jgi:hypothetical protein
MKSTSLYLAALVIVSIGVTAPARSQPIQARSMPPSIATQKNQQLAAAEATCASMQLLDGLSCQVSLKTREPMIVPTICSFVLSAISLPVGATIPSSGISLNGSPACGIDPKTDLPILIPTAQAKALPPIKSRQEKARAAFNAGAPTATRSTMPGVCNGINLPNGMMCLVDAKTGRPKALPNPCLDWSIPSGLTCVVDPETASPIMMITPEVSRSLRPQK